LEVIIVHSVLLGVFVGHLEVHLACVDRALARVHAAVAAGTISSAGAVSARAELSLARSVSIVVGEVLSSTRSGAQILVSIALVLIKACVSLPVDVYPSSLVLVAHVEVHSPQGSVLCHICVLDLG